MAIANFTQNYDPALKLEISDETYISKRVEKESRKLKRQPKTVICPECGKKEVQPRRHSYPICGQCHRKTPEGKEYANLLKKQSKRQVFEAAMCGRISYNDVKIGHGRLSTSPSVKNRY